MEPSEIDLLLDAWKRFDVGLTMGEGYKSEDDAQLRQALGRCADAWKELDAIPRIGANILVDIFPATEANAERYQGPDRQSLIEAAYHLQALVQECVRLRDEDLWAVRDR